MHSLVVLPFCLLSLFCNFKDGKVGKGRKGLTYTGELSRVMSAWVQILALPLTICMTLSKVLNLSVPQFPDLQMGIIILPSS